jgi:hypothetical protein
MHTLIGFTHDEGFRVFSFDRRGQDNVRTRCDVRANLALTRAYGIQVQELPLLCRDLLDRCENDGRIQSTLTFAESDMRACADERAAAREEAAKKRKPWRRPAEQNVGIVPIS